MTCFNSDRLEEPVEIKCCPGCRPHLCNKPLAHRSGCFWDGYNHVFAKAVRGEDPEAIYPPGSCWVEGMCSGFLDARAVVGGKRPKSPRSKSTTPERTVVLHVERPSTVTIEVDGSVHVEDATRDEFGGSRWVKLGYPGDANGPFVDTI